MARAVEQTGGRGSKPWLVEVRRAEFENSVALALCEKRERAMLLVQVVVQRADRMTSAQPELPEC